MDKNIFKDKYRIKSIRLSEWDYRNVGYYFVTICTKDRKHYFGKIQNEEIILSNIGNIVQQYRLNIPQHFSHISLDVFIVMPNHIHGIISIDEKIVETSHGTSPKKNKNENETRHVASLQTKNKFGPQNTQSLGYIINQFKGSVTREINKKSKELKLSSPIPFARQASYYEHVIRNENDYERIYEYIQNNPLQWDNDEYYTT